MKKEKAECIVGGTAIFEMEWRGRSRKRRYYRLFGKKGTVGGNGVCW